MPEAEVTAEAAAAAVAAAAAGIAAAMAQVATEARSGSPMADRVLPTRPLVSPAFALTERSNGYGANARRVILSAFDWPASHRGPGLLRAIIDQA
jgi:hypothetical protein